MLGQITKIHPKKQSRNGTLYIRVEFKLEDGSWAKTDLVPSYRNYSRWVDLLSVGNILSDLVLKAKSEVNADSFPILEK